MLRIMILYKGAADEAPVEAALHASYQRYIVIAGKDELGTASGQSRGNLPKTAAQLDQLLKRPSYSPRGVAAASVSDTKARYDRGLAVDNPPAGKGRDPDEAIFWYGMAAQGMDPRGLTQLGVLLARDRERLTIAMDNASLLWWIASTRGEATAMFNLGAMHEHGVGIPANKKVARAWYEAAARHGNPAAPAALERTAVRE
jgi:TPR repeat protein